MLKHLATLFITATLLCQCGYSFRGTKNDLLIEQGIRKIHIAPVLNNTFKVGVENIVYNAILKEFTTQKLIQLVDKPSDADAILTTRVTATDYVQNSGAYAKDLSGKADQRISAAPNHTLTVASQYRATISCEFKLNRRVKSKKKRNLWNASVKRDKTFNSASKLGALGASSMLVNDSNYDRALGELARDMMVDVHESMLAMF